MNDAELGLDPSLVAAENDQVLDLLETTPLSLVALQQIENGFESGRSAAGVIRDLVAGGLVEEKAGKFRPKNQSNLVSS